MFDFYSRRKNSYMIVALFACLSGMWKLVVNVSDTKPHETVFRFYFVALRYSYTLTNFELRSISVT